MAQSLHSGMDPARFDPAELSTAQLRDWLGDLVVAQFKRPLLMTESDELPTDISYFDLGLTSLRLLEIKQGLEDELDVGIDATELFNRPTVDDLVDYLTELLSAPREVTP